MLPQACLPATGSDNTTLIVVLVGLAAILLAAGVIAVSKSRGRVALMLLPVAALALVLGAVPAKSAQALETAIPSFSFSDSWATIGNIADWNALSENASGQALADTQTLEDMVVEGTATKSTSLTVASSPDPGDQYTFQVVPGSFDDFDFSYRIPGTGPNSLSTAIALLEDSTNLETVLTFTYDYKDSCDRPLQTVLTYTGQVTAPQPVP